MSSVYFPVQVVILLRRLANLISTLSISNQYLLRAQDPEEHATETQDTQSESKWDAAVVSWSTLEAFRAVEWPWWAYMDCWNWLGSRMVEGAAHHPVQTKGGDWRKTFLATIERRILMPNDTAKATGINIPWIGSGWSWHSFIPFSLQPTRSESLEQEYHRNSDNPPPSPKPPHPSSPLPPKRVSQPKELDTIHLLLQNPVLYDPIRNPRYPIVLCHGLYGFDVRGPSSFPSLRMHYWANVLNILRKKVGAQVIVTSVPGTGSIVSRAITLDQQLQSKVRGRGINFLAHSMGGLDCRHLITHIQPAEYAPLSLTTISTPHRGSPFMDWCAEHLGLGKIRQKEEILAKAVAKSADERVSYSSPTPLPDTSLPPPSSQPKTDSAAFSLSLTSLPSSFTSLLLSLVDSPAYANLTSAYLNNTFNPSTPNDEQVKYFSVAGRLGGVGVWHPFWLPKMVIDGVEERTRERMRGQFAVSPAESGHRQLWDREEEWGNDGLVTIQSAKWGEFLGVMEGCDHWEMRGARGIAPDVLPTSLGKVPGLGRVDLGMNLGVGDWGKFVSAWRSREHSRQRQSGDKSMADRKREREQDEAEIKSSTDRLSAVMDWFVDQVPMTAKLNFAGGEAKMVKDEQRMVRKEKERRNELETKEDLERFYVALSRKLWDEGL